MLGLCGKAGTRGGTLHPNSAWWQCQVMAARLQEITEEEVDEKQRVYSFVDEGDRRRFIRSERMMLHGPPEAGELANGTITAITEIRIPYWSQQPSSWATYHALVVLEINRGQGWLACERKTDLLELILAPVKISRFFMKAMRCSGPARDPIKCQEEPTILLATGVTVARFFSWLDGVVEENWEPYNMLHSNCQHIAAAVKDFLLEPGAPRHRPQHPILPSTGIVNELEFAIKAVRAEPRVLKYLHEKLRRDKNVVCAAVSQDGNALRYASDQLRADPEVALLAVQQNGYSLPYVHSMLRQEREIVLAAVSQNGYVLCYTEERHRLDREICLSAVKQDGYAWRYVHRSIKWDPDILLAAGLRNPVALARSTLLF